MEDKKIETVRAIRKEYDPPKNTNLLHRRGLSKMDRLAVFVTERIGTMGFFFIIFGWTISWSFWNMIAPQEFRFDPYPAFVLWLFISNLIQIHLMPLIMVGQNIQGKHAELRAEHQYETNKKAEKEIETILLRLEEQQKIILELSQKIDRLKK